MKSKISVYLLDDRGEKFFGEGPVRLLRAVEEYGSLRRGAASMGMSYSKALRILKNAEHVLGFPLTERTVGGSGGGKSTLTEKGKEWMEKYEAYKKACEASCARLYTVFFS